MDARKFYDLWLKIQRNFAAEVDRLQQLKGSGAQINERDAEKMRILDFNDEEQEIHQKDLLFIESGEDVEDLFIAFKHYN